MILLKIIAWLVFSVGFFLLSCALYVAAAEAGIENGIEEQPTGSRFVVDPAGRLIDTSEPESPDYHV